MNVFKPGVSTCLALISISVSMAVSGQPQWEGESDVPPRRMAFPAPEHLSSLLPRSGVAECATKERALDRTVRFRRDAVELASFDKGPTRLYPLERFSAQSGRRSPSGSRPRTGSAIFEGSPVAPSFPPDPRPAPNR